MARILVLGVKVPFTHGGQEVLVSSLVKKLRECGHEADTIELPYNPLPKENLLAQVALWRSLDLTTFAGVKIDLVIGTKFPSYYARHPRKSVWLVHQLRSIYDLYGGPYSDIGDDPRDEVVRTLLTRGDEQALKECTFRAAISENVARRLEVFNGLPAKVLYPPLAFGDRYRSERPEPYILAVGRICRIKRLDLIINALPHIENLSLKVVGVCDEPGTIEFLHNEIAKHNISSRVEFLGRVDDEQLIALYARATAVYYAPYDEDYGYVTLEAMASGRPVVTATDSGGTLEFISNGKNGYVADPTPVAVATAFNTIVREQQFEQLSRCARMSVEELGILEQSWEGVIQHLLSPLESGGGEAWRKNSA